MSGINFSWTEYGKILSSRGYNGIIFESSFSSESVDDICDSLHLAIKSHNFTPPVLISHSFGSYISQSNSSSFFHSNTILYDYY